MTVQPVPPPAEETAGGAPPRLPPVQSLADLTGAIVLGVRRAERTALVLLERADGSQIAVRFEAVTDLIVEPAAHARVTAIRWYRHVVRFDFDPGTPARLEVWAGGHVLAPVG